MLIQITDDLAIDERTIAERFVRASGPGGQNVNKVATAVELRFDIESSSLPDEVKARLKALAGNRVTADGILLVDSRTHRTQGQNREVARVRLVSLIRQAATAPRRRRPSKPKPAARRRRLDEKKQRGQVKALRRSKAED